MPAVIPNVVNAVPTPLAITIALFVAVLSQYKFNAPPILAAYTPVILAVVIAVTNSVTVSQPAGIVVPLITIVLVFGILTGVVVPWIVAQALNHSSLPTSTQVLYKPVMAVSLLCVVVGPPRLKYIGLLVLVATTAYCPMLP